MKHLSSQTLLYGFALLGLVFVAILIGAKLVLMDEKEQEEKIKK